MAVLSTVDEWKEQNLRESFELRLGRGRGGGAPTVARKGARTEMQVGKLVGRSVGRSTGREARVANLSSILPLLCESCEAGAQILSRRRIDIDR